MNIIIINIDVSIFNLNNLKNSLLNTIKYPIILKIQHNNKLYFSFELL